MSITNSIIVYGLSPSLYIKPSSQTRNPLSSSLKFESLLFRNSKRVQKDNKNRRRFFVCNFVQPEAPPPSEPPVNFINWIVGVALTVVLPFFTHKWASLLNIKNEVETAVETIEEIVEAVEKVADNVEKVAEDISDDLPEGGRFRKAVDFIENVAERASMDAHLVGDFIDRVQEAEDKVETYVQSNLASHENPKDQKDGAYEEDEQKLEVDEVNDDHKQRKI